MIYIPLWLNVSLLYLWKEKEKAKTTLFCAVFIKLQLPKGEEQLSLEL